MYYGNLLTFSWGGLLHQVTFYVYLHAEQLCPDLFCFSWREDVFHVAESWLNSVVGRVKSYTYVWCSLMRFIQTKQQRFKSLWCVGMSTCKRQGGLALKWASMLYALPGQCQMHMWNTSMIARKTFHWESSELGLSHSTVHDVLYGRLKLCVYRLQLVQKITHMDQDWWKHPALEMLSHTEVDEISLNRIIVF
jgi:hypothetical protein